MKYKILVSGNNPSLIMDFIQHTGTFFKSLSTTPCMRDIIGHFELFSPDAYVCFVNSEHSSILTQISAMKRDEAYNGAGVFLICDAKTCDEISKNLMFSGEADLIIRRPISVDNLVLRITRYFDEKKEAQAEEEARKTPAEAKTAADTAKEKEEEKAAAANKSERKHVLVIDDDRIILKMLKEALSDEYDVTTMVNGVAAEKFLEAKKVDLVILDYEMPIETGADIFRRIKNNPKISHIPVCFLTGISEREKIMEVMALKPHGYLLKPIDMDMLIATVSNLTN
ncbi:MAG: response regulator [Oscillospiraceae bacterium]|nr:response regulator [Oscillospiraceae bacterium]